MLNKKSVDDINVKGKRVLVRCDFNVPLKDGKITDENRLVTALPTIKKLMEVVPRESYIASIGMYGLEVEVVVGSSLCRCSKAKAHGCDDKYMSFFHACCCLLYCKFTHIILYILLNCRKNINFSHFLYPMCGEKSTFASII